MVEIKSIEQLLYFMKGHIHLSRYDEKFIENISTMTQVTTNQVVLFHNLIEKYRRQLFKHELYPEKLVDLPWNVTVIESSPKYTNGHVKITNNMIYFTCPFSRKFIDEFRKEQYNQFTFEKEERRYEAPYNQYSLKILLKVASKFFDTINLCPVTQELIRGVKKYECVKYWSPTLVKLNDRLYILGINSAINDALGDLVLNTDLSTLSKLAGYGIQIDTSLYDKNSLIEYVSANHIITVEHRDLENLVSALEQLKCDMVYLQGAGLLNAAKRTIIEQLDRKKIPYTDMSVAVSPTNTNYELAVIIKLRKNFGLTHDPCKVSKVIHVVNSLPIEIK